MWNSYLFRTLVRTKLEVDWVIAQRYVGDQLTGAQILFKAGYTRATGTVAGVLLECYLKLLCNHPSLLRNHPSPAIPYPATAVIAKLNDLLRGRGSPPPSGGGRCNPWGIIRNSCDHAGTDKRCEEDVADLIADIRKFIAMFTPES